MCRSIFGIVLLSACADFTVGTVATHPHRLAWHRRLRKRRQIARWRLRQHCATPADCWRIATHHGSCLPGAMTTVNHDNRRKCTTRDCRHPGGPPSAWDNRKGTRNGSRTRTSVSRRWTCPDCSYQNYAWRGYCHSCSRAVSFGGRGNSGGGSLARKPAQRATFGDDLSAECERLRGGDSLSSEAMAVEDLVDVAIDEVLRQKRLERQELKDQMQSRKSTKAFLKAAIAAREKAVIKLEGLQEISDVKSEAA